MPARPHRRAYTRRWARPSALCLPGAEIAVMSASLIALERELRESLRGGYLFGNFDEPLDTAGSGSCA